MALVQMLRNQEDEQDRDVQLQLSGMSDIH